MQNFAIERLDSSIGSANTKVLSLGLTERWDALVAEIRHLPGFEEFLRPTKFQQLQEAAKRGPVVIVNVSDYRSDAIAILCDGTECPTPITVPLGRNLYQEAKFWVVKLVDGTRDMATYYRYGGVKGGMSDDFFERTILNRIRKLLEESNSMANIRRRHSILSESTTRMVVPDGTPDISTSSHDYTHV